MRVTQSMLNTQMLRNVNNNLSRLDKIQNQLSTGREINKPSDDPVGISFSLRYRNALSQNEQFERNVDSAISWVEHSDKMIGEANDILQRARELAVQGANGTNSDEAMEAIAAEIDQLHEHLVSVGNSQFNGKYIFNGQKTDMKPFDIADAETVDTHNGKILLEVGVGITLPVNMTGADFFGKSTDADNAFKVLKDLSNALKANDTNAVDSSIGLLDSRMDNILEKWANVGARANRIELVKNRIEDEKINLETLLSKNEDADMAELMIKLKTEENIYQASLSTGARIIKPSLVDFLR